MEASTVNTTVVAVSFAVYTLAIITIGLYSARFARRSDEDYFLAGRSLGGWIAALSASASSESGWVTLGLVGLAFTSGASAYWIIPGCLLGYVFNWFVLAGPMRDRSRQLEALTLPDLFSFHFKERVPILRIMSVIVIIVAMWLYVAAQLSAAGKAFSVSFDGINYRWGVVVGASIVLLYTVLGGFRAVCWTDFLQALLMVGTLVIFPAHLLLQKGGYGFIASNLDVELLRFTPDRAGLAFLGFLLGHGALGINFGYPGQPHVLVRFMALKTRKEAFVAGTVAVIWGTLVYWGAVTIGLMARAMTEAGADWGQVMLVGDQTEYYRELGLVLSAMHLLPPMMAGLVLAAVLAAICSTADSQLVVAASAAANDLYARLFGEGKAKSHMLVNRLAVLVLGIGAVLLVIGDVKEVYSFVLDYGWAILGASFGPQVILLLLWKRASYAGCVAGMFTGFTVALLWKACWNNQFHGIEVYNLTLGFIAALVVNVVVSLIVPRRDVGRSHRSRA